MNGASPVPSGSEDDRHGGAGLPGTGPISGSDAVLAANRLLLGVIDRAPVGVLLRDLDGRYLLANASAAAATHRPVSGIVGRTPEQIWPRAAAAQILSLDAEVLASGTAQSGEISLEGPDGGARVYAITKFPVRDADGAEIVGIAAILREITAERDLEARLRERERQLSEAQELAQVGSWERLAGEPRARWSAGMCRIFGQPEGFSPSFAEFGSLIHPEDRASALSALGAPETPRERESSFRIVRPDGELRWVTLRRHDRRNAAGELESVFGVVQDVTDRHRAESALGSSEALLAAIIEHAPAGIIVRDLDGTYQRANRLAAATLGVLGREVSGHRPEEFFSPAQVARIRAHDRETLRTRAPSQYELTVPGPDGGETIFEVIKYPIPGPDGEPAALGSVALDVTAERRATAHLRARERELAEAQEIAALGTWEWRTGEDRVHFGPTASGLFGHAPGFSPTLAELEALLHPDDRQVLLGESGPAPPLRSGSGIDVRIRHRDGRHRHLHVRVSEQRGPSGAPARFFGTVQDMTDRAEAEHSLRESEQRLAEAQRLAHLGSWEFDVASGRLLWSEELCRISGQPLGFSPTYEAFLELVIEEDREAAAVGIQAAQAGRFHTSEYRIRRPDGEIRHVQTQRYGRTDPDGRVIALWGTSQDVTEQRRVEEELRRAREYAEAITAAMAEGYVLTVAGEIVAVNDAFVAMTGFSREELMGMRAPYRFWPAGAEVEMAARSDRVLAAGGGTFELPFVRRDGSRFGAEMTARPARNPDGSALGTVTTVRDVSAQHAAEAERAQRAAEDRALRVIAERVAQASGTGTVLDEVTTQALSLFEAHSSIIARFDPVTGRAIFVTGTTRDGRSLNDRELNLGGDSAPAQVYRSGRAARAGSRPSSGLDPALAAVAAEQSDAVAAPIVVGGQLWGCVAVGFKDGPAPADAEERAARFAALAGMAIANAQAWDAPARAASTDPLTGLANRRVFEERLAGEFERAQRHQRPLSLVLLDLDHFKAVNDRHGHPAGDRTLVEVARRLEQTARAGELVARIGGEEFAWLLPETDAGGALSAAERLREVIAGEPFPDVGPVTISAGVCDAAAADSDEELRSRADRALYAAKASGRNTTRLFQPGGL
ncbi:PAS domain S-box protein [Conexibacter sp. DBS9H8]|uniref:PAS domain S-box protein n=1 Tax=Conexibacter sp. DBS9H8 TaxID=2937801 RepID=UPI00200EC91C|nr:PAS domain S-box protein [Conexibacter sp. DBS9H8]